MNNFQKYGLLLAIIFSILLHLIFIEVFSFKIFQSDNQEALDDIEITIVNSENLSSPTSIEALTNMKKLISNKPLIITDKKSNNENNFNQKITTPEASNNSINKLIDVSKILSDIRNFDFSTET